MSSTARDLSVVRLRLTKMTDRILMRLHDRAGFPLNRPVYEPGAIAIPGRTGTSLLDFSLEGLEAYHASLGRFEFPGQYALSEAGQPRTPASRSADQQVKIALRESLVDFYTGQVLPRLCTGEDDAGSYGETAYVDADLLELLNERINIGRDIALAKVEREPDLLGMLSDDARLRERLTDRAREETVITDAAAAAERYALEGDLVRFIFRWIIDRTLALEVEYLQRMNTP